MYKEIIFLLSLLFILSFYQLFEENRLAYLNDLKEHHTSAKEKSLNKFKDLPKFPHVDFEQDEVPLKELGEQIEKKYLHYVERAKVRTFFKDANMHCNYLDTFITTYQ